MTEPQEVVPTSENAVQSGEGTATPGNETPDAFQAGWSDVFDALPGDYRKLVEEPLKEHDRKYQELQTKWNSVKDVPQQYLEAGPDKITQAMQILERIQSDPHGVLNQMAEALGVSVGEVKQAIEDEQKQQEQQSQVLGEKPVFTDDDDPRLRQMWDIIEKQNQRWEQAVNGLTQAEQTRLQQEYQAAEDRKIDEQITTLINEGKIPNDPNDPSVQQNFIGNLMMHAKIALDQGSKDPIMDGYKAQQQFLQFVGARQQSQAPKNYPLFMPTNGAPPANAPKPPDTSTEDGRLALMQQIARQAAGV